MSVVTSDPRLCLLSQTGVEETVHDDHGIPRVIKTVAKKGTFTLRIGQVADSSAPLIDFSKCGVCCTLVLDQNRQMSVESLSTPLEFKVQSCQAGTELRVDIRVNVLSSQYERSFFCVLVQLKDQTGSIIPGASLYTEPFRVRSKVKLSDPSSCSVVNTPNAIVHSPRRRTYSTIANVPNAKRPRQDLLGVLKSDAYRNNVAQTANDSFMVQVLQALGRIEERQIQAQQTFSEAISVDKRPSPSSSTDHTSVSSYESPDNPCDSHVPCTSFCQQFLQLVNIFSGLSDLEKQQQVEAIRNTASPREQNEISLLLGHLQYTEPSVKQETLEEDYYEDYSNQSLYP